MNSIDARLDAAVRTAADQHREEALVAAVRKSEHPGPARWAAVRAGFSCWSAAEAAHFRSGCPECAARAGEWDVSIPAPSAPAERFREAIAALGAAPGAVFQAAARALASAVGEAEREWELLLSEQSRCLATLRPALEACLAAVPAPRKMRTRGALVLGAAEATVPAGPPLERVLEAVTGYASAPLPRLRRAGFAPAGADPEPRVLPFASGEVEGFTYLLAGEEGQWIELHSPRPAVFLAAILPAEGEPAWRRFLVTRPRAEGHRAAVRLAAGLPPEGARLCVQPAVPELLDTEDGALLREAAASDRDPLAAATWRAWAAASLERGGELRPAIRAALEEIREASG